MTMWNCITYLNNSLWVVFVPLLVLTVSFPVIISSDVKMVATICQHHAKCCKHLIKRLVGTLLRFHKWGNCGTEINNCQ